MDEPTNITDAELLALPDTPAAREALDWVKRIETEPLANHSIRSFLFARLLGRHRGLRPGTDYDPELLFLACVLHDVGLSDEGNGGQRFEVDGADLAARFLTERGFGAEEVDTVWQSIALHTSPGIVERRGVVCALASGGTAIDVTADGARFITEAEARLIHGAYPRLSAVRHLFGAIADQIAVRPEKAPPASLPGEVARLSGAGRLARFEDRLIEASRWDD
ncbi:HD domain-containing protein [Spirillospora sp. NPDC029432]|uniref:HD domain-containing protein n=1 Tax=Spirillospora sp. NPDC029432 TaxID=3154599 RepID=UPI0034539174